VASDEEDDEKDEAMAEKTKKSPMAAQNQYQLKQVMMKDKLVISSAHWSRWTSSQNGPRQHQLEQK
jgi:hypothetical protein